MPSEWEGLEDDAVDDGFDGVVLALFEAHAFGELDHLAVDAGAEALLVEGFELFAELAFAAADDGGVDGDAFAGGEARRCARRSGRRTGGRWGGRSWGSGAGRREA